MNRLVAMESPISAVASPVASMRSASAAAVLIACSILAVSKSMSGLKTKAAVGCTWLLMTALVTPVWRRDSAAGLAATTRSQAEQQIGAAGGDAHRIKVFRLRREPHVAHHRAVLLRQPGDVEHGAALAFEMRRHAEERADRDDAGAADAGDEDAVGPLAAAVLSAPADRQTGRRSPPARRACAAWRHGR